MPGKQNAISIFNAGVDAVHPSKLIAPHVFWNHKALTLGDEEIILDNQQKIFVIGAGKAAAAMAKAVENILGDHIFKGLITTKYDHDVSLQKIKCLEAAHPVPDQNSFTAVEQTLALLKEAKENDIIICLLSGGASALWADTPDEISSSDLMVVFDLLLKCGAPIQEVNTIRKHLSKIKGGQLLKFAPSAKWFSLIISDVPDNDLSVIASGPTTADDSRFQDALYVLKKYQLEEKVPPRVWEYLQRGEKGLFEETIKKNNPLLNNITNIIIGTNEIALKAAGAKALSLGYQPIYFNALNGDASAMARTLIRFSKSYNTALPTCIITGGETTVQVTGNGVGGRNQQMALSALIEMKNRQDNETAALTFLAAGTDGTDGPTDSAGAIADIEVIAMSVRKNLDPVLYHTNCDAYTFFKQTGGLLKTGATQTNVMDIAIVLIE